MAKTKSNTLRNFKINDDLFYQYEFVATQNMRNVTAQLTEDIKKVVDSYKKSNPGLVDKNGNLPYTDKRIASLQSAG